MKRKHTLRRRKWIARLSNLAQVSQHHGLIGICALQHSGLLVSLALRVYQDSLWSPRRPLKLERSKRRRFPHSIGLFEICGWLIGRGRVFGWCLNTSNVSAKPFGSGINHV